MHLGRGGLDRHGIKAQQSRSLGTRRRVVRVLLVEANPGIATMLAAEVRERNPTPRVPPARVIVVNEGVCPSSSPASELPFYTLDTRGLEGLPRWADQVSSFKYQHVQKHTSSMARKSNRSAADNHSAAFLRTRIVTRAVRCGPLLSLWASTAQDIVLWG